MIKKFTVNSNTIIKQLKASEFEYDHIEVSYLMEKKDRYETKTIYLDSFILLRNFLDDNCVCIVFYIQSKKEKFSLVLDYKWNFLYVISDTITGIDMAVKYLKLEDKEAY